MLKKLLYLFSPITLFSLMCLLSSFTFNGGCTKTVHDTTTVYDTITVHDTIVTETGTIFLCWLSDFGQSAVLCSDPTADTAQSQITIRWDTNSDTFPYEYVFPCYLFFENELYLSTQTNYTIRLNSDIGSCEGTITIPEGTSITEPSEDDTLPLGQNVIVTWTKAQGASLYEYDLDISAYDSSGNYLDYYSTYGCNIDTTYTIDSSLFNVPNAAYYSVWFIVEPFSGPRPEPGAQGNMTGTIPGFLNGVGYGDGVYFYVGTPVVKLSGAKRHNRPSIKERMNNYLKQLGSNLTCE
uniref:Fibronectin type-III domain-containing protein n=1 Tax=candidate division WOR-3 bacterium TaxID=2052148 RepID=A0A7C4XKF9_UNCW3